MPGPPINVQAYNTSSTSLNITWDHVLPNERYEDVIAYKIILNSVNDQTGVSMVLQRMKAACNGNNGMYSHETHLNIFTPYEIIVASVVRTGIGNFTEKITVLTDEDGEYLYAGAGYPFTPLLPQTYLPYNRYHFFFLILRKAQSGRCPQATIMLTVYPRKTDIYC